MFIGREYRRGSYKVYVGGVRKGFLIVDVGNLLRVGRVESTRN